MAEVTRQLSVVSCFYVSKRVYCLLKSRRVMRVITDAKYEMAKMLVSVKSGGAATGIGSE